MIATEEKTCTACGVVKPLEEFGRAKGYAGGHRTTCDDCNVAAGRAGDDPGRLRLIANYLTQK